jgi:hypothetical protein
MSAGQDIYFMKNLALYDFKTHSTLQLCKKNNSFSLENLKNSQTVLYISTGRKKQEKQELVSSRI